MKTRRLVGSASGLVAAVFLGLLAGCHTGDHLDLTVNVLTDGVDAVPGDGICEITPSGADCSLRAAIDEANAQPATTWTKITLAPGTHTLTIAGTSEDANATGDLDPAATITITGDTTTASVIDASGLGDRAIDVQSHSLSLTGVTISGGTTPQNGGAVRVTTGAELTSLGSTYTANTAATGGAIAIDAGAQATLTLSTLSANTATTSGGAVDNAGTLDTKNTTITDNTGGGIATTGTTTLASTIVADQTTGTDCTGTTTTAGHNLDSDSTCLPAPGTGDQPSANALLAPLASNGGVTQTHLPHLGSDAIDTDDPTNTLTHDQRTTTRPQGTTGDIGATEPATNEQTGSDCGPPLNIGPGAQLQNCDLGFLDLSGANLAGADLSNATALFVDLSDADLTNSTLTNADLTNADLRRTILTGTDLSGASLRDARMGSALVGGADFTGADLDGLENSGLTGIPASLPAGYTHHVGGFILGPGVVLSTPSFAAEDLSGRDLRDVDFGAPFFPNVDLSGADLRGADLSGLTVFGTNDLSGADLRGADISNADLTGVIVLGTRAGPFVGTAPAVLCTGCTHHPHPNTPTLVAYLAAPGVSWSGADLSTADFAFPGFDFSSANLAGADLSGTSVGPLSAGPVFDSADLSGADLTGAALAAPGAGPDFSRADLTGAALGGLDLGFGRLNFADLTGATGTPLNHLTASYRDTTCPTGVNSDVNGDNCQGQPWP